MTLFARTLFHFIKMSRITYGGRCEFPSEKYSAVLTFNENLASQDQYIKLFKIFFETWNVKRRDEEDKSFVYTKYTSLQPANN